MGELDASSTADTGPSPTAAEPPPDWVQLQEEAVLLGRNRRHADAEQLWREVLKSTPEATMAWKGLADALIAQGGRAREALDACQAMAACPGPLDDACWATRARAHAQAREWQEAVDAWRHCQALAGPKFAGHAALVRALLELGQDLPALDVAEAFVASSPQSGAARVLRALALAAAHGYPAAEADLAAVRSDVLPAEGGTIHRLIRRLLTARRVDDADRLLAWCPFDALQHRALLSLVAQRAIARGDWQALWGCGTALHAIGPEDPEGIHYLLRSALLAPQVGEPGLVQSLEERFSRQFKAHWRFQDFEALRARLQFWATESATNPVPTDPGFFSRGVRIARGMDVNDWSGVQREIDEGLADWPGHWWFRRSRARLDAARGEGPRDPVVPFARTTGTPLRWLHTGDLGDVMYALPAMQAVGEPVSLFLIPSDGTREPMLRRKIDFLQPLLEAQPYIHKVRMWEGEPVDVELADIRRVLTRDYNLARAQADYALPGRPVRIDIPWLAVDAGARHGRPVFARSARYRNARCEPFWEGIKQATPDAIFVGTVQEFREFGHGEHIRVGNALELAILIQGASIFVGNQSFPYAVAEGLKVARMLEVAADNPNCSFPGAVQLGHVAAER